MRDDFSEEQFIERLNIERLDRDIFRGRCHAGAPMRAFGGHVAAQALVAAGRTVDDELRAPHSLHAYFLRPGSTTDPIIYLVDRPRDGRTFATRRVQAVQYGETIFTMSASFARPETGVEHQHTMPLVPGPEKYQDFSLPSADHKAANHLLGYPQHNLIQLRIVDPDDVHATGWPSFRRMAWMRTDSPLPDSNLVHYCTLTYFADLTLGGTVIAPHASQVDRSTIDIASIDHAMWFHQDFRADEWVLFVQDTPVARSGHGLARGEFFSPDGSLIATSVQEILVRPKDQAPVNPHQRPATPG